MSTYHIFVPHDGKVYRGTAGDRHIRIVYEWSVAKAKFRYTFWVGQPHSADGRSPQITQIGEGGRKWAMRNARRFGIEVG